MRDFHRPSVMATAAAAVLAALCVLAACARAAQASGAFEVQILGMQNSRGHLADGNCCGGSRVVDGTCPRDCSTFFRVCLKEYQEEVSTKGPCTFGNTSSTVLGSNSFTLTDPDKHSGRLVVPFTFRWTRSVTLILEAVDHNNITEPYSDAVIERTIFKGIVNPGSDWHTMTHNGPVAQFTYRVRVLCDPHYYNATCTKFCRPRDDYFGHYTCDANGDKVCVPGWMSTNCDRAMCKPGCHSIHGYCDVPSDCKCRHGWQGKFCEKCVPYPGCKHGSCEKPWECTCFTNWGGMLCDQDLNYCGTHEPCQNGGTCENTAPDEYMCRCPKGFSGINCEIAENPCVSSPCLNKGTCSEVNGGYKCTCAPGWTGDICQTSREFTGPVNRTDANECQDKPCVNALSCKNTVGDYECLCRPGWTGKNCDQNVNDCRGQCGNGATCIDLVNDYHCACRHGFTGRDCQTNINECQSNPCRNGGECVDLVATFKCICPMGFAGSLCEVDNDLCNPNPCHNNMPCINTYGGEYFCHCSSEWEGKNCSIRRKEKHCQNPPCQVLDSCRVPAPSNSSSGVQYVATNICGEHGRCVSKADGAFSCDCHPGYTGQYCHENINDCAGNMCHNGGTCVDGVNSFQCICTDGWEGTLCHLNKNECSPNPCQNNGTCVDGVADFRCECKFGWKGKMCTLRHGHCDLNTCNNGGTCEDRGDHYVCHCKEGWVGNTCQMAKNPACTSNPCKNGATCVNVGDSYSCICKEGFEGFMCEHNINDCNPYPCFNGGKCIDGVNWFLCECAQGFAGPDCRININECSSSPCAEGSTCIDEIGEFRCVCPVGRTGDLCEKLNPDNLEVSNYLPCIWKGHIHLHNGTWKDKCNTCTCNNGQVHCGQVWCGLPNCLDNKTNTHSSETKCGANEICRETPSELCISPPCPLWGECQNAKMETPKTRLSFPVHDCAPNEATVNSRCAKITLLFDRMKLPKGTSVQGICSQLRTLSVLSNGESLSDMIYVLCDIKNGFDDTLEVTLSTLNQLPEGSSVNDIARDLADYVTRKLANISALTAIVEVKLETAMLTKQMKNNSYVVALICSPLAIAILLAIVVLLLWHHRRRKNKSSSVGANCGRDSECANHESQSEVKSNNQNEENLRRYCNPLNMKACTMSSSDSTEMLEISFDEKMATSVENNIPSRFCKTQTTDVHNNANVLPTSGLPKKNCDKEMNLNKQKVGQESVMSIQRTDKEMIV